MLHMAPAGGLLSTPIGSKVRLEYAMKQSIPVSELDPLSPPSEMRREMPTTIFLSWFCQTIPTSGLRLPGTSISACN